MSIILGMNPRQNALDALRIDDPTAKAQSMRELCAAALHSPFDEQLLRAEMPQPADLPGRPAKPQLVAPKQAATRSPFTPAGRAALLHAVAHIEFNAINLALDAGWRFPGLPGAYYRDWLRGGPARSGVHRRGNRPFDVNRRHLQDSGCGAAALGRRFSGRRRRRPASTRAHARRAARGRSSLTQGGRLAIRSKRMWRRHRHASSNLSCQGPCRGGPAG